MDSKQPSGRPAQVLLVEDNNNDVELTRLAFEMSNLAFRLHHVNDGVDCMAFLRKEGQVHRRANARPDPARFEYAPKEWA